MLVQVAVDVACFGDAPGNLDLAHFHDGWFLVPKSFRKGILLYIVFCIRNVIRL